MKKFNPLRDFLEAILNAPIETAEPEPLSGWQVICALWPINERFRPRFEHLRSLPYNPAFEAEADQALEHWAKHPGDAWADRSAGCWRVLLERQMQAITLAVVNQAAGNPVMFVPRGLPTSDRTMAAALFLLHAMQLPWPPEDRSNSSLPSTAALETLRPH